MSPRAVIEGLAMEPHHKIFVRRRGGHCWIVTCGAETEKYVFTLKSDAISFAETMAAMTATGGPGILNDDGTYPIGES